MQRRIAVALVLLAAAFAGWALRGSPSPSGPPVSARAPAELSLPRRPAARFSPDIRVCLTDSPAAALEISIEGPYLVSPIGSPLVLDRGPRLSATTARATATGIQLGGRDFSVSRLELAPERSPAVWVDGHQYRGRVRLLRTAGGNLRAVNVLPLDEYVASVVDSEMPAAFPDEARRAQAIVARTYALWQRERRHPEFDLFASTRSQRYLGFQYRTADGRRLAGESADSRRLAEETAGMVCTRRGRLFCAYYSAACGGRTVLGRAVFEDAADLASVPCAWCRDAPLYRWTRTVARAEFEAQLAALLAAEGLQFGTLQSAAARERGDGTVQVLVGDGRRQHSVEAAALRGRLGSAALPSPRFTIELSEREVRFEGRGHGHGVGFCQWGARGLAQAGRPALEILAHYYPGSRVVVLDGQRP